MTVTLPVVVLVGPPNTGKTRFYNNFLNISGTIPKLILVDTPRYHDKYEYSWQGVFKNADIILDFGGWMEDEVFGVKLNSPKYMTWSGDDLETMKRIEDYLQEKK